MWGIRRGKRGRKRDNSEGEDSNDSIKVAKPVDNLFSIQPKKILRQITANPNLSYQLLVIVMTLTSENAKMERGISGMTNTLDSLRNIADVLNTSVKSIQSAAEAPKHIRRLLNPQED